MIQLNLRLSRAARLLAGLTLLAGVWVPPTDGPPAMAAPQPPARPSLGDFVYVDRDDDSNAAGAKLCTDATDNDCNLRGAIEFVNALGTVDNTIYFDNDVTDIFLLSALPTITKAGTWIVGVSGTPTINAFSVAGASVLTVNGNDILISGLSIVNGPASGFWADIGVIGGEGARISNNYLGLPPPTAAAAVAGRDAPGASSGGCTPTGVTDNSVYGVIVTGTVGASGAGNGTYITGNTIVCHSSHGVAVFGSDYVFVGQTNTGGSGGNFIGVTSGGQWLPNSGDGVAYLAQGSNGVRYGIIRDNTIAGNNGNGVSLVGTGSNNTVSTYSNVVRGNRIGLDSIGTLSNGGSGVRVGTGAFLNQIGGTSAAERNVISGNNGSGVFIANSNGNGVLGNYIGTNLSGSGIGFGNGLHGVSITGGDANIIGGFLPLLVLVTAPNVIANNSGSGISLLASAAASAAPAGGSLANTLIVGNYIGTDVSGNADRGNSGSGIDIQNVATGVITGNVVSGNGSYGVYLLNSQQITVTANRVGTNAAGTAALENGLDGVALTGGSNNNLVGGRNLAARNILSGNNQCGIEITGSTGNEVGGNFIGLNLAGTAAVPNEQAGVCLNNADSNDIGGTSNPVHQYIAGNLWQGLRIVSGSDDNFIWLQNHIGVAYNDVDPVGNGLEGVLIDQSSNNRVYPTIVANNGGAGLAVTGNTSANNMLIASTIRDNGGLPVDLGNNGHTPNDAGDGDTGPNGLLNYPEITASSGSVITGTTCANCGVDIYLALGDPTAPGGGGNLFASTTADGSGQWSTNLFGHTAWEVTLQTINLPQATSELSPLKPGRIYLPLITK